MGIHDATIVYGVGFDPTWEPRPPREDIEVVIPRPPRWSALRPATDAEIVAEVLRRLLDGSLSPRCRAMLADALRRAEE